RERAILVTGSHRSGSTWLGRVLSAAPDVVYVHEPFSPLNPLGVACEAEGGVWFQYINHRNEAQYVPTLSRILGFDESFQRMWWALDHAPWPEDVVRRHGKKFIVKRYVTNMMHRAFGRRALLK